jgi:hypothetical protein
MSKAARVLKRIFALLPALMLLCLPFSGCGHRGISGPQVCFVTRRATLQRSPS